MMLRSGRDQMPKRATLGYVRIVECDVAVRQSLAMLLAVKGFQVEQMDCHGDPLQSRDDGEQVTLIMGDAALQRHESIMTANRAHVSRLAGAFLLSSIPTPSWERRASAAGIQAVFEKPFLSGLVDKLLRPSPLLSAQLLS